MKSSRYIESLKSLDKAKDALENAKYNLNGGFLAATANRTYYTCYYCITALLYTRNIYSKTHQGVRAKFTELFIKTSIFPIEISNSITLLFDYLKKQIMTWIQILAKKKQNN